VSLRYLCATRYLWPGSPPSSSSSSSSGSPRSSAATVASSNGRIVTPTLPCRSSFRTHAVPGGSLFLAQWRHSASCSGIRNEGGVTLNALWGPNCFTRASASESFQVSVCSRGMQHERCPAFVCPSMSVQRFFDVYPMSHSGPSSSVPSSRAALAPPIVSRSVSSRSTVWPR
jgi:hypothetical protein